MPQTIWTKPVDTITFADVQSFCETGASEGINLDYKREFPAGEKLARTVCAFANTFGGVVLVGVDEDDESRPKPPFTGLPFEPKLEERVWNVLTEHIHPPIFPEVRVCPAENDRTFILIRVAASATSPHAIRNNSAVFLRVGNVTKREERERLATVPEVSWLADRRAKSVELKHRLVARAYDRCGSLRDLHGFTGQAPKIHVWLGPKFPTGPLATLTELDRLRGASKLYADRFSEVIRVHEGVTHIYKGEHDLDTFTETNIFGFTFHSAGITAMHLNKPAIVFASLIADAIADVVRFSSKFLPAMGYWGDIELHAILRNVRGTRLIGFGVGEFVSEKPQVDESFEIARDLQGSVWRDEVMLEEAICDLLTSIVWAFGGLLDRVDVRTHLSRAPEWRVTSA